MSTASALTRQFLLLLVTAAAIAVLSGIGISAFASNRSASAMISDFHTAMLEAWKSSAGLSSEARQDAFRPVVADSFDTPFMARMAAGSFWNDLSGEERGELVSALADMTVASYAARFKSYDGQQLKVLDERSVASNRVMVRTQIIRKSGNPVNITYLVERMTGRLKWSIIDVWFNSTVSELALRRTEFAPVLRQDGASGLLQKIKTKTAALSRDDAADGAHTN